MHESYRVASIVNDKTCCGILKTDFIATREMRKVDLTVGGLRILRVPNAGGSSVVSEVMSFELLSRCFSAKLKKTEMEVSYFPHGGSITDYVCEVFQETVGVSVTRAMKYRGTYTYDDAYHLLNKKLRGIIQSSKNSQEHWSKQILHIWSTSEYITEILMQTYTMLDPEIKSNTVVIITTAKSVDYLFN